MVYAKFLIPNKKYETYLKQKKMKHQKNCNNQSIINNISITETIFSCIINLFPDFHLIIIYWNFYNQIFIHHSLINSNFSIVDQIDKQYCDDPFAQLKIFMEIWNVSFSCMKLRISIWFFYIFFNLNSFFILYSFNLSIFFNLYSFLSIDDLIPSYYYSFLQFIYLFFFFSSFNRSFSSCNSNCKNYGKLIIVVICIIGILGNDFKYSIISILITFNNLNSK